MTLVNVRLIPGKTSTESGVCSKDGGSKQPGWKGHKEKRGVCYVKETKMEKGTQKAVQAGQ